MNRYRLFSWAVTAIFIATTAFAQQGNRTNSLGTESNSRQASLDSTTNVLLQRANITPQMLENLQAIGVDVHDYLSRNGRGEGIEDERCQAATSDLVFIGKVLGIVDMPGSSTEPFHSKVNVQIIEILRGPKQLSDTIQLLRQSGSVTDDSLKSKFAPHSPAGAKITVTKESATDARYKIGETSVFFADNIEGHPYLTAIYKSTFKKAMLKFSNPSYFVMFNNKFQIKDSAVRYYGRNIPLEKLKSEIKQVAQIVDKP